MISCKARLFNWLILNRHLLRGKIKREVFDFNTSIPGFREQCEKGVTAWSKLPPGMQVQRQTLEGMTTEWLIPEGSDPAKIILYFHGGGYVAGSCSDHRGIISKLAWRTGIQTLIFEYRLAPEHPFPAAVEDSVSIYRHLLSTGFYSQNILFAGESAGGGLCLSTLLKIKEQALEYPVAAVAISPWTDLTCSGASYKTKNKVSAAPLNSWYVFSRYYAGHHDPAHPLISPLFGDLSGLPPLLINSGENDELYDDGRLFAMKAKEAGVNVIFRKGEGMIHCYPLMAPMFREASEAMDEIVTFIRKYVGNG